ncbi:MAG: MMPL family transporter [Proteobacteria bacterium]|nr:MMPL family transporter [Pseudomonadota bacterium]
MNRFIDLIVSRYKSVLVLILLLTVVLGSFCRNISFNHTADVYFKHNDPKLLEYNEFQDIFGNEELGLIIFEDEHIFSNEVLGIIREISQNIEKLDRVDRVYSITQQDESITEDDTLGSRKIVPEGQLSDDTLSMVKDRVLGNKSIVGRLISKNGNLAAIAFELSRQSDSNQKIILMENIRAMSETLAGDRLKLHFNGVPFFESEENKLTVEDLTVILPMMILLSGTVILFLFRSLTINTICFLTLLIINVIVMGLFSLAKESINIVTSIMAAVLINVSMADLIHFIAHYKDELIENNNDSVRSVSCTIKAIWQPCLFTSLTTAVGFVSFLTATIRPIQILGLYTAIGTMIAFVMTITFFPATLLLLTRKNSKIKASGPDEHSSLKKNPIIKLLAFIGEFTIKRATFIRVASVVIVAVSIFGISKVTFKSNTMNVFKEDNQMVVDLKFIEKNLGGTMNSEVVVTANSEKNDFSNPDSLAKIEEIQSYFETLKERKFISSSFSINNYFKEVNKAFNNDDDQFYTLPKTKETLIDYFEIGDSVTINRFISRDKKKARITYQIFNNALEKRNEYMAEIDYNIKKILGPDYSYIITGTSNLWSSLDSNLKESFMSSFIFACIVIFLMMIYVCKGLKLAILSMVPNTVPILLTIGLMGWLNIPFDTLTVMIVCVTLGINVDDTVHFIVWFKRNIASGLSVESSLLMTYKNVGTSIISTSIILAMGFVILSFGSYLPYQTFGLLTAFNIIMALLADLFLLPSLILFFEKSNTLATENFSTEELARVTENI